MAKVAFITFSEIAGAVGIGPTTKVLETLVIPFHHAPKDTKSR